MIKDENNLPDRWEVMQVKEIGEVNSGSAFSKEYQGHQNKPIPFYKVGDMGNFDVRMGQADNYVDENILDDLGASLYPENSLIFPKIGEAIHTNKKRILSRDSAVDNNVMVVTPDEEKVNPKFLYYAFRNTDLGEFTRKSVVPSIRQSEIEEYRIPVPPLDEQERIVSEIEDRLSAVEAVEQSVDYVKASASEYNKSLLTASLSGQKDMSQETISTAPKEEELPKGWGVESLSELAEVNPRISLPGTEEYAYLPMRAIDAKNHEISKYERREDLYSGLAKFEEGDILAARITPCFENGKMAVVNEIPDGYEYAVGSSELVVIRPKGISKEYLFEYLKSPVVKQWGESRLLGATGRERIKVSQFKNELMVPVPPESEQSRLVKTVNAVDTKALNHAISNSELLFDEIRESILAYAFRDSPMLE